MQRLLLKRSTKENRWFVGYQKQLRNCVANGKFSSSVCKLDGLREFLDVQYQAKVTVDISVIERA